MSRGGSLLVSGADPSTPLHSNLVGVHVQLAGIVEQPHEPWMRQIARNLTDAFDGSLRDATYLIHDRDLLFCAPFRGILAAADVKTVSRVLDPYEVEKLGFGLGQGEHSLVKRQLALIEEILVPLGHLNPRAFAGRPYRRRVEPPRVA